VQEVDSDPLCVTNVMYSQALKATTEHVGNFHMRAGGRSGLPQPPARRSARHRPEPGYPGAVVKPEGTSKAQAAHARRAAGGAPPAFYRRPRIPTKLQPVLAGTSLVVEVTLPFPEYT
jgi:hypothetical protein